ncbi:hypothetical protein MRX96_054545 [Rhipicephalus microplus]
MGRARKKDGEGRGATAVSFSDTLYHVEGCQSSVASLTARRTGAPPIPSGRQRQKANMPGPWHTFPFRDHSSRRRRRAERNSPASVVISLAHIMVAKTPPRVCSAARRFRTYGGVGRRGREMRPGSLSLRCFFFTHLAFP